MSGHTHAGKPVHIYLYKYHDRLANPDKVASDDPVLRVLKHIRSSLQSTAEIAVAIASYGSGWRCQLSEVCHVLSKRSRACIGSACLVLPLSQC